MWYMAKWMGYSVRLELTRESLLIYLVNHYTTRGAQMQKVVEIYYAFCLEETQGYMNGAPNETRKCRMMIFFKFSLSCIYTHSYINLTNVNLCVPQIYIIEKKKSFLTPPLKTNKNNKVKEKWNITKQKTCYKFSNWGMTYEVECKKQSALIFFSGEKWNVFSKQTHDGVFE